MLDLASSDGQVLHVKPEFAPKGRQTPHVPEAVPSLEDRVARLQEEIVRINGVKRARVIGNEAPQEIHVVSDSTRPPKQLVRDVQSLAAAGFGISIDHRIVSVVQLGEEEDEIVLAARAVVRPILDRVVLAIKGTGGWVRVGLKWPNGEVTEGTGVIGTTREARARGATQATQKALESMLERQGVSLDVDHVLIQRLGSSDSVTVRVVYVESGVESPLVGSALIHDDTASAAVRALLQAVNRKLV